MGKDSKKPGSAGPSKPPKQSKKIAKKAPKKAAKKAAKKPTRMWVYVPPNSTYKCPYCKFETKYQRSLIKHTVLKHPA